MRLVVALGVVLGLVPCGRVAAAELQWTVPAGCPNAAALESEVSALVGKPLASLDALRIEGVIRAEAAGQFHLWLRTRARTESEVDAREIDGHDCKELCDAAAVAIALALTNLEEAPALVGPSRPIAQSHEPAELPPRVELAPRESAPRNEVVSTFALSADALLDVGAFRRVAWGAELAFAWDVRWLRFVVLGDLLPSQSQGSAVHSNSASFALAFGGAMACGRAELKRLRVIGCAGIELGRLWAAADGVDRAHHTSTAWRALSSRLIFDWPITRQLAINASLGLSTPLTRPEFYVDDVREHQTAAVCFRSLLGLAIALP